MHIVQIEDFFHPDTGYQPNILSKYFIKFGHQVTIIAAELDKMPDYLTSFFGKDRIEERDRAYEEQYGIKIVRVPMWKYVSGRAIYAKPLLPLIKSLQPDILFVHNNDTAVGMWATWNRKKLGCPLIMDNHMCEMASQNPLSKQFQIFYRHIFTPMIRRNGIYVIATAADRYAETVQGVPRELSPLISFGSDTMLFHPDAQVRRDFRAKHGIAEDAFVVLYAGKMDESKGGQLLADLTCQKLNTDREVVYVIVGNAAGDYGKKVEETFGKSPCRVLRFPTQKYVDLAQFFQAADLGLMPKQCSLMMFDINACGVPMLMEHNEVNDVRCTAQNGWLFDAGNLADFKNMLEKIVNLDPAVFSAVGASAQRMVLEQYNYEDKAREFENLLFETVNRHISKHKK